MSDFETRARSAARAVRAVADAPDGPATTAHRSGRGPVRALLIAAAVVVGAAVVGTTLATRDDGAGPASDVTTFCAGIERMARTPVDVVNGEHQGGAPDVSFLQDAPEDIRADALEIMHAVQRSTAAPPAASRSFARWWQVNCYPAAATPDGVPADERFAPDPAPGPFTLCGAATGIGSTPVPTDAPGSIAIYGERGLPDPYAGPMIGLVRTRDQQYYQDDHAEPIAVAGHAGAEIVDATGPGGAAIEGLGQTVTWKDDHGVVAVIGRGYTRAQAGELAAIAGRVADAPDGLTLSGADGDDLVLLHRGPVSTIYAAQPLPGASSASYTVSYRVPAGAGAWLSGVVGDATMVDAMRFFSPGLRRVTVGGTPTVGGDVAVTNSAPGSMARVVRWRAGDVVLTLTALGTDQAPAVPSSAMDQFVEATHRLDRPGWERVVGEVTCTYESSRASSSGSGVEHATATSSTSVPATTPGP